MACNLCDGGLIDFHMRYVNNPKLLLELFTTHGLILDKKVCEKCGNDTKMDVNRGSPMRAPTPSNVCGET